MINKENFIIDRYVRGNGYDPATGERMYTMTQMKDMNLKVNIDNSVDVVDAEGSKVETIEKGVSATLSGSNAFLNFDLLRHQLGASYEEATEAKTIMMPKWEEFVLTDKQATVILKEVPAGTAGAEIGFIYVVPAAGGASKSYAIGEAAAADKFTLAASTKTLTLPTGLQAGDKVFVEYEYAAKEGFKITKAADDKTKEHKFVALVLGHDLCDKNTQYAAWQVFPKAKFSQEIDQNFATDAAHTFTLNMTQDYCASRKVLFEFLFDGNAYAM